MDTLNVELTLYQELICFVNELLLGTSELCLNKKQTYLRGGGKEINAYALMQAR